MSDSTVKIETQAELKELLAYTQAVRDQAAALRELAEAQAAASGSGGGAPSAPGRSPGGGAPPPAPPTHPAIAASTRASTVPQVPGGASTPGSGAPPPPPPPAPDRIGGPNSPRYGQQPDEYTAMGRWIVNRPGYMPPPAPPPASGLAALMGGPSYGGWSPTGGAAHGPQGPTELGAAPAAVVAAEKASVKGRTVASVAGDMAKSAAYRGTSFLQNTASTAIGVGLGTSLFNFPLDALNHYQQLSKVIAQVDARFRDAAEGSELFATKMGYGIARSAQLADSLGSTMNTFTGETGIRYAGFARATGADPDSTLRALGKVSSMAGRNLSALDLAGLLGSARTMNMDQGRMDEFLQRLEAQAGAAFQATGHMSIRNATTMLSLPSQVYGLGDPRAENDPGITDQIQGMLTSKGPMRAFLMRAHGFGRPGGMSKRELDLLTEQGIYDPEGRNIEALVGTLQKRGVKGNDMYEAVLPYFEHAWQADAFTKRFDSPGKLQGFLAAMRGGPEDQAQLWLGSLSEKERAVWNDAKAKGEDPMAALGRTKVSLGEAIENRREGWQMTVGAEMAKGLPGLMNTLENLGNMLQKLIGGSWGDSLARIANALDKATSQNTVAEGLDTLTGGNAFQAMQSGAARTIARTRSEGLGAGAGEYLEYVGEIVTGQDLHLSAPGSVDLSKRPAGAGAP